MPSSTAIPIAKLKGKTEGGDKLPQLPVAALQMGRRANSYQPPSVLESVMGVESKKSVAPESYIRPKRVSTSTGHQRPSVDSDDFIHHVPLSMQQSGFIPVVGEENGTMKRTSPKNGTSSTSSAPLPSSLHQIQQQQQQQTQQQPQNNVSVSKKFKAAAEGARSGSGGTERSRSRTSSVSEESRVQNIIMHHPPSDTFQEELQALMVSPHCASPPNPPGDSTLAAALARATPANISSSASQKFALDLAFSSNNSIGTLTGGASGATQHTPVSIGPATDEIPGAHHGSGTISTSSITNAVGFTISAGHSSTTSSENASASGSHHSDHPTVEGSHYETSSNSSSSKNKHESNSNVTAVEKDVFRTTIAPGSVASSAPASSTMRTITVSTFSKSGATTHTTTSSKPASPRITVEMSQHHQKSNSQDSSSIPISAFPQIDSTQSKAILDAPAAGTAAASQAASTSSTNVASASTSASASSTSAIASATATSATSAVQSSGTGVNSATGSPRSTSLANLGGNDTDSDSLASGSDFDEYSDDDDLGYIRVGAHSMSSRNLVQHLSVWAMDEGSDSDSDSSLSSDDDDDDDVEDEDSSDSDSGSGDDDDGHVIGVGIGIGGKGEGGVKSKKKKKKKTSGPHSRSGSHPTPASVASASIDAKPSSTSKRTASAKGTGARAQEEGRTSSTMFHMEDVSSPSAKRSSSSGGKKRVYQPSKWLSRPLPADGPTPYLKLPSSQPPPTPATTTTTTSSGTSTPLPNSSAALAASTIATPSDFSIVNVKRSRHERELQLEYFNMKVVYDRQKTGFEATHDFPIRISDVIAGRYEIVEYLGSAAFSRAVKCIDHLRGTTVCLKIIKNNKDYFDQSLDEIKLLTLIRTACGGRCDEFHVLELYDYFYFKEHLFLVCELLRENLYEVYKYNRQSGETIYFNIPRLQRVAWQCLIALNFIHRKNLIHCDLKPENILIKSYSRSLIKVIDFGSSCFTSDQLSSYVQSRSYRAPEVVLGYPYDQRIDIWSLGCILAELWTGRVLFQNESLATLIAKHIGIIGVEKSDRQYLKDAPLADDIFTTEGVVFEKKPGNGASVTSSSSTTEFIQIKKTTLRKRLQTTDALFLSFVSSLLRINPMERPTSWEAMHHPWFRQVYPEP